MNRTKAFFLFTLLASTVGLSACSGLGDTTCTSNCGGGGGGGGTDATLSVTFRAKPLTPPPNTNILSYSLTIGGLTLTPASGNVVNFPGPFTVDLVRLQSDSAFLGSVSLPAGTYTSITASISSASVTYCTATQGVAGCNSGSVTQITGGAAAPVLTLFNGGLVLASGQSAGIAVVMDMGATLTVAGGAVTAVTLTNVAPNVSLSELILGTTRTSGLTSTQLDYIDDVTGSVTVSGNNVTITTANYGTLTATADSNTFYSPNCVTLALQPSIACVQANQVASADIILKDDGTLYLAAYDPISAANATNNDWIEGTVVFTPTNATQFHIVANDASVSTSGSLLPKPFPIGSPITVALANNAIFGVDTQGLNVPADYTSFTGNLSATVLLPGQTVAVHVTDYQLTGGSPTGILATVDGVELRFTRIAGTSNTGGNGTSFSFTSSSLPPYFGFTAANQLVELTAGAPPSGATTYYDGVSGPNTILASQTYSVRALYFGQFDAFPLVAAKVRQNP
jgi:uncharacterized protein DUF4382